MTSPTEIPEWLSEICARHGLNVESLRWLGRSQNEVWEHYLNGERTILRVSSGRGRTIEEVQAELGWLRDLSSLGVRVSLPICSPAGRWCERVTCHDGEFLSVVFHAAPGRKVEPGILPDSQYRQLGRLTAQLHAASWGRSPPAKDAYPRPMWFASRLLTSDMAQFVPAGETEFRAAIRRLIAELTPRVAGCLGLVHADISYSNTFLEGERLTIFDFDNCEIGSVEQDLATVWYDSIYCRLLKRTPADALEHEIDARWRALLAGYRDIRPGVEIDLDLVRDFIILREAVIYTHYCRIIEPAAMTDTFRSGMVEMRVHVEQCRTPVPFVN